MVAGDAVAQLVERATSGQDFVGLIPSSGTCCLLVWLVWQAETEVMVTK